MSISDIDRMRLTEFLIDYAEAAEEEQKRQKQMKQSMKNIPRHKPRRR